MIPGTLPALLARRRDGGIALLDRGRAISYVELADESRRVARGLRESGVRAGDAVAIWMPKVPAWLATFLACAQLGAVAICVNTRFRSHELADILGRSEARALVYWPGFRGIDFAGILAGCPAQALRSLDVVVEYGEDGTPGGPAAGIPGRRRLTYMELSGGPALEDPAAASPDAGCAVFTTSGTTSAPKFVLHDQQTVVRHAFDVARGFDLGPGSVLLLAPPLCGVFGFCGALACLAAGRPFVMTPAWDPARAVLDIATHKVTHLNATDEAFAQLLDVPGADFSTLRVCGYAAFNPAHADIVARADARGLALVGLYGASEIQALFARQDERAGAADRALAGGRPVHADARVRARDPATGAVLPHGEAGELEFFAPASRMVEYKGNPEATRRAFTDDGYYRSGDLGRTLADGRFVFLARMGDSLRLAGFLVSPAEIEDAVQEIPGISACQVVGVARRNGVVPVAFVILAAGARLDEAAAIRHVASRLAPYKVPRRIVALDAFPVTPGANATKIQKGRLREMAEALLH